MAKMYYSPFIPTFNSNGAPFAGAQLVFYYTGTSTKAPIYSDASLTIEHPNPVPSDGAGKYPPIYMDEDIVYRVGTLGPTGALVGDYADPYYPGQALKGDPGAAGNVAASLAQIKAADTGNVTMLYDGAIFNWTPGNFTGQSDDINIIKADSTALSVGAWVRQSLSDLRGTPNVKITDDRLLLGAAVPSPNNHAVSVTITRRTDDENGQDIYFYSNQTDPDNQRMGRVLHVYADADGDVIDMVGAKVGQKIRQAWNPAARSDKGPYYVGTGWFSQYLRTRPNGGGVYPDGNQGGMTDRLAGINPYGNIVFYGSDATEWDEDPDKAPIQIGTYEYFLGRKGYFGYKAAAKALVIGSIDTNAGTFEAIQLNATAINPVDDMTTGLGGLGFRYTQITASQFRPGTGAPIWTSGTGSPEGIFIAPPGSLYTDESGGAASTLWVKESGTGSTGWVAK